ncbi:phage tail protein [Kribbella sp. NPDC049174]|uniref:phage tail protein n=1 Tax=Kribbella sp. NPDC049174 TaxID=3364112 RepID=UPI0037188A49
MTESSSYLAYLPPVLWRDDPRVDAGEDSQYRLGLGATLRIFEKIATGIPDGIALEHADPADPLRTHTHLALTDEIADLHRLFDPWTTPTDFLPWLASWVALEFPTLQGIPLWEEYQRRKVTAEIAQIYRLRGRKTGLNQYLDLYAVGQARPRVSVDDGARLLSVTPQAGELSTVSALVSQGPVVTAGVVRSEGLTRPWCVAAGTDGSLFVGDIGLPEIGPVRLPSRVWHLDRAGRYELSGTPPRPAPLAPDTANLKDVVAVVVRPARAAAPETLYVLTRTGRLFAVPAPFREVPATLVTTLSTPGTAVWMVALVVDPATGDLLALDRGGRPPQAPVPTVVTVRPNPLSVTRTRLTKAIEPLSLSVEPSGTLLLGDGGDQEPADSQGLAGNLLRIDRGTTPWREAFLLPADNPLVAPTASARIRDGLLYVLDVGLKPFAPSATDPFICPVAEHAAIYAVDLAATPPTYTRTTVPGEFVYPTGMVAVDDHLVVSDPGQPEVSGLEPYWGRVRPFEFDVSIHFTESRLPADPAARKRVLDQAVGNISSIVAEQKPAHTLWTLNTSIL